MSLVYLIPSPLDEETDSIIPSYILEAISGCQVFFVENERTTRRYFKKLWKTNCPGQDIIIDDYEWHTIDDKCAGIFRNKLKEGKKVGIVSEAGCPGVADPGQELVAIAQEMNITVKPLVGPSAILLALMASGMNGQKFCFEGYLPIDTRERINAIKELEAASAKSNCTRIFIETPYRNHQLLEALVKNCRNETRLCVAVDISGKQEWIRTQPIKEWKKDLPSIHKRPAIFLLYAGN